MKPARTSISLGRSQSGFSLVELMVASLLGLILLLAAAGAFIAGSKTIGISRSMGEVQENSRAAFELMARDIREAGGNPCSTDITYSNVLTTRANPWWDQWIAGIYGYGASAASPGTAFGTGAAQRVANTHAIDLHSALEGASALVSAQSTTTSNLVVDDAAGLGPDVMAVVCDISEAFIFQVTSAAGATNVAHGVGGGAPGNCTAGFMPPTNPCGTGTGYIFGTDANVSPIASVRWYIGNNADGSTSLFRATMINRGGSTTPTQINPVEIARGVSNMQVDYRELGGSGAFVPAASVTNWRRVKEARIRMTFSSDLANQADVGADTIERTTTHIVALRNH